MSVIQKKYNDLLADYYSQTYDIPYINACETVQVIPC